MLVWYLPCGRNDFGGKRLIVVSLAALAEEHQKNVLDRKVYVTEEGRIAETIDPKPVG